MTHRNGGPPKKVAAPPPNGAATTTLSSNTKPSSGHRRQDGYTPPTAEDREVAAAIEVLRAYGYGIACRCLDCNRPITAAASLARMRGRRCAERAEVVK